MRSLLIYVGVILLIGCSSSPDVKELADVMCACGNAKCATRVLKKVSKLKQPIEATNEHRLRMTECYRRLVPSSLKVGTETKREATSEKKMTVAPKTKAPQGSTKAQPTPQSAGSIEGWLKTMCACETHKCAMAANVRLKDIVWKLHEQGRMPLKLSNAINARRDVCFDRVYAKELPAIERFAKDMCACTTKKCVESVFGREIAWCKSISCSGGGGQSRQRWKAAERKLMGCLYKLSPQKKFDWSKLK